MERRGFFAACVGAVGAVVGAVVSGKPPTIYRWYRVKPIALDAPVFDPIVVYGKHATLTREFGPDGKEQFRIGKSVVSEAEWRKAADDILSKRQS